MDGRGASRFRVQSVALECRSVNSGPMMRQALLALSRHRIALEIIRDDSEELPSCDF